MSKKKKPCRHLHQNLCKIKVTVFNEALQTTNEQGFNTAKYKLYDNRLISRYYKAVLQMQVSGNASLGHKVK